MKRKKMLNKSIAVLLSLAMLLVFPGVSFADEAAVTAGAVPQTVEKESSQSGDDETADVSQIKESAQTADSTASVETEVSEKESSSSEAAAPAALGNKAESQSEKTDEAEYPYQTFYGSAGGTDVNVTAPAGALPAGTKMRVRAVSSSKVKDAVESAADGSDISGIQALDISFWKDGSEIEPRCDVTVKFSGIDMKGDSIDVYHMTDVNADAEKIDHSDSATTAKVVSDEFSIYVLVSLGGLPPVQNFIDPITLHYNQSTTLYSTSSLIPFFNGGRWWIYQDDGTVSLSDASGGGYLSTPSVKVHANKPGEAIICFTYKVLEEHTETFRIKVANDQTYVSYLDGYGNSATVYTYVGALCTILGYSDAYLPAHSGYEFAGWSSTGATGPVDNSYAPGTKFTITGSIILNAVWRQISHNVSYSVTGTAPSSYNGTVPAAAVKNKGDNVTVADALSSDVNSNGSVRGTWSFSGWTSADAQIADDGTFVMPDKDVTLTGSWTFTAATPRILQYAFEPDDYSMTLPAEVLDQLPAENDECYAGDIMTAPSEFTSVPAVENGLTVGTWSFDRWLAPDRDVAADNTFTMPDSDIMLTGIWVYIPADKYGVSYDFVSADPSKTLPAEVMAQLPSDANTYYEGEELTAADNFTSVPAVENGITVGTWSFGAMSSEDVQIAEDGTFVMPGNDVRLTGTWNYTEADKYKADYKFVSADPSKTLPSDVTDQLPSDSLDYYAGESVTAPTGFYDADVEVNGFVGGTWHFTGWDKAQQTFANGDVTFTGTWEYEKETVSFAAHYKEYGTGNQIAPDSYGSGDPGSSVDYNTLSGSGLIPQISGYSYKCIDPDPLVLGGRKMPVVMRAMAASEGSETEYEVTVYYTRDPEPAKGKYTLTINYVDKNGKVLHTQYSEVLTEGAAYSQTSPSVSGYKLVDEAQAKIAGVMPASDLTVKVVYKKTSTPSDSDKTDKSSGSNKTSKNSTSAKVKSVKTTSAGTTPKTGDDFALVRWMILALLGAGGAMGTVIAKKRRESDER